MKKFIILSGSVDGQTCEDDGFVNCANFDLVGTRAFDSRKEAEEIRDQTIEQDLEDFKDFWEEEDGYEFEIGDINFDKYLDVFYGGDVIHETIYKIREVEF